MLGGSVGLAPDVTIGKGARVAARSGVMNDIPPQQTWGGYPARPKMQWMRQQAVLARLARARRQGRRGVDTSRGELSCEARPEWTRLASVNQNRSAWIEQHPTH